MSLGKPIHIASHTPRPVVETTQPKTVAEQIAEDPKAQARGTVISKLPTAPKPEAEPKHVETIKRPGGEMIVRNY
jgi:hypothetical protein